MLVLSRKQGESIVIGDRVRVRVQRISRSQVRLAVEAPGEVSVDREEIWLQKHVGRGRLMMETPK